MKQQTPSMYDKHIPSPPRRTVEQYEADKAAGIHPWGRSYDRESWAAYAKRCRAVGVEPEDVTEIELARLEACK